MFIKILLILAIIATSAFLLLPAANAVPCGPSENAASPYAPGGPGGYPPGNNPFNQPPDSAPGQLKQDQTPLP